VAELSPEEKTGIMKRILHLRADYLQEILFLYGVDVHPVEAEL
jgi:hypothetical protein